MKSEGYENRNKSFTYCLYLCLIILQCIWWHIDWFIERFFSAASVLHVYLHLMSPMFVLCGRVSLRCLVKTDAAADGVMRVDETDRKCRGDWWQRSQGETVTIKLHQSEARWLSLDLQIYICFITTFHIQPAVYSRLVTSNPVTIVCSLQNYELKQAYGPREPLSWLVVK